MRIPKTLWVGCVLLASYASSQATWPADTTAQAKIRSQLEAVLEVQERANFNGEGAAQLAERFYAPDVVIVGEGDGHASRGRQAVIASLAEWIKSLGPGGQKGCHFQLEDLMVMSPTAAASFVTLTCKANPPALSADQVVRQLFVWKRLAQGWRVTAEMWGMGRL